MHLLHHDGITHRTHFVVRVSTQSTGMLPHHIMVLTQDCKLQIWHDAWSNLSTGGRGWFTWPDSEKPRKDNDEEFERDPPGPDEDPLSNYCLCVVDVYFAELSKLRDKLRIEYHSEVKDGKRLWEQRDMNP